MRPSRGGYDGPLLEELVAAGASEAVIRDEGYTDEEAIRATVASSLRSTSDTVSIGPHSTSKHRGSVVRQPRRGVSAGIMPSGPDGAPEQGTGTAVAPRGGLAGHRHVQHVSFPG